MKLRIFILTLILAGPVCSQARAQDAGSNRGDDSDDAPSCENANTVNYFLAVDKRGVATPFVNVCIDPSVARPTNLEIERALDCPGHHLDVTIFQSNGMNGFESSCEKELERHGLRFSGAIDVEAIEALIKETGDQRTFTVDVRLPDSARRDCTPRLNDRYEAGRFFDCTYSFAGSRTDPSTIRFSFGYGAAELARMAGVLTFLLLLPIGATLWLRRRALRAPEQQHQSIWFAYFRFLRWTTLGGALVWWTAIDLLRADEFASYIAPMNWDTGALWVVPWLMIWIPPLVVYGVCLTLSTPIHRLRGTERTTREAMRQAFWGIARIMLPMALLILAIGEMFEAPRVAVVLVAAMLVMARVATRRLAKAYGIDLYAITSGDLRDRAFALAENAKAKLYQLYVLPTEQLRMANAFAHVGHNIFLTDYLLKHMSKREVDAVIGHEVAHLQKKHIGRRIAIVAVGYLLVMAATIFWKMDWVPDNFPSGPLFLACLLLVIFFVTRRNEYAADAGAAQLTGDPEAMITGLAKLSRLNTMPMQWGKVEETLLTHPSMIRRITRLARRSGISDERVSELLRNSMMPPADTYAIPTTSLPAGKVFSTRWKATLGARLSWTMLLVCAATPAMVAWVVERFQIGGLQMWAAYTAGLLLTVVVALALANFLPARGLSRLERMLREKFAKEEAPAELQAGLFVGLSPDREPRLYESNWVWDVGVLGTSEERLYYWGEEARFVIGRNQIVRVWAGPGPVSWIPTASAMLTWIDPQDGRERTLSLRPMKAGSLIEITRLSRLLARDLENWKRGLPPAENAIVRENAIDRKALEMLGPPAFGVVTSLTPSELARGRFLAREILVNTFLAVGAAVLAGLRFPVPESLQSGGTGAMGWGAWYVVAVVWTTRILLLIPYRRSGGRRDGVAPSRVVAAEMVSGESRID